MRRSRRVAVLAAALAAPLPARALETDQYYAWADPPRDVTDVVNAKFDSEILRVLDRVNASRRPVPCEEVSRRIMRRFRFLIFQDIEVWAMNSRLVDRVPRTAEESSHYLENSIYGDHGPLDVAMSIPPSPTIQVGGILIGTDKLAHFVSGGWRYYERYRRALRRGLDREAAEEHAIRTGILVERLVLGQTTSGVLSLADLEANYQGMRFYAGLCEGEPPALVLEQGRWRFRRRFDLARYVSPEWDESYQGNIYGERRWERVRPRIVRHCTELESPRVRARRGSYARRDRETPTERVVAELVRRGKLADPARFRIEQNCPRALETRASDLPAP